jgi:hypothetical protein
MDSIQAYQDNQQPTQADEKHTKSKLKSMMREVVPHTPTSVTMALGKIRSATHRLESVIETAEDLPVNAQKTLEHIDVLANGTEMLMIGIGIGVIALILSR